MTNPVQQAILERRSIRDFRADALTADQLSALTAAALASPSANDHQPWHFHFVLNPAVIEQVSQAAIEEFRARGDRALVDRIASRHPSLFYGAPLVVFVSLPRGSAQAVDVGIAVENLALSAQGLGLGSCIIGLASAAFEGPAGEACRRAVGLDSEREFSLSVAIGHAATTKPPHDLHPDKISWIR